LDDADALIDGLLRRQPGNETFLARKSKIEEYRRHIESEDAVPDSGGGGRMIEG
jgi:hypothetical protein